MSSKLTILFYGKTSKTTREGLLPIYLRVTINGKRFEVSTGRYLDASRWSAASGRTKGNTEEARSLNAYLDTLRTRAYDCQRAILSNDLSVNIQTFREEWNGKEKEPAKMLVNIFEDHNRQFKELVGKVYAENSAGKNSDGHLPMQKYALGGRPPRRRKRKFLFGLQTFHRIRQLCFYSLEAYCQ